MGWLLKLLGVDPVGKIIDGLTRAHESKLKARNATERVQADITIKRLQTALADAQENAGVIKKAMEFKVFWIPWLMAAVPVAAWFGWGMIDSLCNGALPDVAELPPQLKEYADVVWKNIFYTGAAGMGVQALAGAIKRR